MKYFKILSVIPVILSLAVTKVWAQEPYAVLSDNNTVLTFYYDDQKDARGGMSVGPFEESSERWNGHAGDITTVVFDDSFADCTTLTSTAWWFYDCSSLTSIEGIINLKTANVTDMEIMFCGCSGLTSLDLGNFNTSNVTNMNSMFCGCSGLTSLDVSSFNTENVTDMFGMFSFCFSLTSLDLSNFNTANVTDMVEMFDGCSGLTSLDVSGFNTENVTNMGEMFSGCSGLTSLDVSGFNTSNVTDMGYMFSYCSGLTSLDVSNFNTSNVTNMGKMFSGCSGLTSLDLSSFNTANVTYMYNMFYDCSGLTTIYAGNGWSTAAVTEGNEVFTGCTNLVGGAGTTYDKNHTDYTYAHIDGGTANPGYFTSKDAPTEIYAPYFNFEGDNLTMTSDTQGAIIFYAMEGYSTEDEANNLRDNMTVDTQNTLYQDPIPVTTNVVVKAIAFVQGQGMSDVTTLVYDYDAWQRLLQTMVHGEDVLSRSDITMPNDSLQGVLDDLRNDLTWMLDESHHFYQERAMMDSFEANHFATEIQTVCDKIEELLNEYSPGEPYAVLSDNNKVLTFYYDDQKDARGGMSVGPFEESSERWNGHAGDITTVVFDDSFSSCTTLTSTAYWFYDCSSLTSIEGIINLKTANVTDMRFMFSGCSSLMSLDVSGFNTGNVTSMYQMFNGCSSLASLDVSGFNTARVKSMYQMFYGCSGLTTLDLGSFNTANVKSMLSVFEDCSSLSTIFVGDQWSTAAVTSFADGTWMFKNCTNLVGGAGTTYDPDHTDYTYAHIDGGVNNPGYFTAKDAPASPEPYAVLSDNNTVLTFYYDGQKDARGGMSVGPFGDYPDRGWNAYSPDIQRVVFSDSFADYRPEATNHWFYNMNNLTVIEGIENLHTERVESMQGMFHHCYNLQDLDVSGFNTMSVTNMWGVFEGCRSLTTLDVSSFDTSNAVTMESMFRECSSLTTLDLRGFHPANVTNFYAMFKDCSSLVSVDLRNFNTPLVSNWELFFDNCSSLSSIQASNANIPQEVYASIENPNLLVYVNEESLAPQSVTNVVVDGHARLIVLTDTEDGNNNWYCPEPFYADSIVYTHDYRMTTQIGVSRGWETIALPFNVQNIRHEKNGALAPFGSGLAGKPFWLRTLSHQGLMPAERIEANVPYLISMPNNALYLSEYNQAGTVTFSASNTEVYMTEQRVMESDDRVLMPAFQRVAPQSDVYAVNRNAAYGNYPEGSVFVAGYREVRPFEAYTLHPNGGAKLLTIDDLMNGDTDDIDIQEMVPADNVKVYDLSGVLIKSGNANEVMKQLPKGIYIVNGMKVVK